MPVPVQNCEFVCATDVFQGFPTDIWTEIVEGDPNFTWGSNNRSMVTIECIIDYLDNAGIEYPEGFRQRCEEVGLQMYVDLEN